MSAQIDGERQSGEIIGHQRDIGCLQRDIRACGTHCYPDGGIRHGRSIVDPVSDHRNLVLTGKLADGLDLVVGHEIAPGLVEADFLSNRIGHSLVVARDHDHSGDPEAAQRFERRLCCRPRRVEQTDRSKIARFRANAHRRPPALAHGLDSIRQFGTELRDPVLPEHFELSDPHPLTAHTQRVVYLEDGDIAVIHRDSFSITSMKGHSVEPSITVLEDAWGEADLGDAPHYMYKEIYEQPDALRQCISGRVDRDMGTGRLGGMDLDHTTLVQAPHVRLLGCGTAAYAAEIGQMLIEKMGRIPAVAHISSEFRNNDTVINPKAIYLAVSQSGETADTISAVKEIKLKGGQVFGVVNVVGSTIARLCGQGVYIHSGPEQSVASTKAFTNMVAALTIFATQLGRTRHLSKDDGRELIAQLQQAPHLMETYFDDVGPIADAVDLLCEASSVLFLGRGLSATVAKEGALKLMELAYIPCLAYPAGEMKHGPIALLEEGSPVVVIAPNDHLKQKTMSALHEVKARGAKVILIHEKGDPIASEGDVSIAVPAIHPWLTPLLTVVPLQLIAYETALRLGRDVDRPRNLAKSVTVE